MITDGNPQMSTDLNSGYVERFISKIKVPACRQAGKEQNDSIKFKMVAILHFYMPFYFLIFTI